MKAKKKRLLERIVNQRAKLIESYSWERKPGGPLPTLEDTMAKHQKAPVNEAPTALINEGRIQSNITQKWATKDIILDDWRNFIIKAVDAGGEDMARDLADAFKLLSNFAMGEYKKSKR